MNSFFNQHVYGKVIYVPLLSFYLYVIIQSLFQFPFKLSQISPIKLLYLTMVLLLCIQGKRKNKLTVARLHLVNSKIVSPTLSFFKQRGSLNRLEFLHDDFLNRYRLDLQNQLNFHTKQKANKYTDQSYSMCVLAVSIS